MKKARAVFLLSFLISTSLFAQTKHTLAKAKTTAPQPGLSPSIVRGKTLYTLYCLSCHQADGGGVPNMNPPLIQTSYVLGDKYALIKILLNGFSERVDIEGDPYSNNMPAHNFLKDNEVADVLNYIRNSFGNKASAVKPAEVKLVRREYCKKTDHNNDNVLKQ